VRLPLQRTEGLSKSFADRLILGATFPGRSFDFLT
jgi:hypothetical protein